MKLEELIRKCQQLLVEEGNVEVKVVSDENENFSRYLYDIYYDPKSGTVYID